MKLLLIFVVLLIYLSHISSATHRYHPTTKHQMCRYGSWL